MEYAIAEWQDVCRKMLLDRKPLTSNTVLRLASGNRNLIEEDLFVDLALVKPKRSQNEKHAQDIDPERGSDLFNRQEETVEKRFAYSEFLEEIIRNPTEKNIAIIGEPGAGKTTLLQKLAFWLLQQTDDLVIWVDLAELGDRPLVEYLEEKWQKEALGKSRAEIKGDWEHKFKGGAVWLLLDGLDEMSQSDRQGLKFRGWVMNARIVVTCRLNLWQSNPTQLQGFQTYLTQPFQDEQMQGFIWRWFPGLFGEGEADRLAESLWSELQGAGKERIKDLCRNPLRLTLLCSTWQVGQALPETTAELYGGFVESMYEWKEDKFEVTEEEKEELNTALGALAKASLDAETSRFRLSHRLVCDYLGKPKAKGSLFPLALQLGWLNEVGVAAENPRQRVYTFYHATFQEYFAALAVEDWDYFLPKDHCDRPVEGKRYRIFEKQWKQVILVWLGRWDIEEDQKDLFINKLLHFKDRCGNFYEFQTFYLAALGFAEFEPKNGLLVEKVIRGLIMYSFGYLENKKECSWYYFSEEISSSSIEILQKTNTIKALNILENWYIDFQNIYKSVPHNNWRVTKKFKELDQLINDIKSSLEDRLNYKLIKNEKDNVIEMSAHISVSLDSNNVLNTKQILDSLCHGKDEDIVKSILTVTIENIYPEIIQALLFVIKNNKNLCIVWLAADFLARNIQETEIQKYTEYILDRLIILSTQKSDLLASFLAAFSALDLCYFIASNKIHKVVDIILCLMYEDTSSIRHNIVNSLQWKLQNKDINLIVIDALKKQVTSEIDEQDLDLYSKCYSILWHCAQHIDYTDFYQVWHYSNQDVLTITPKLTLEEQILDSLQNQPILILNAQTLTQETRESKIALKLCKLIWKPLQLKEIYPEVSTPGQLTRYLDRLQLNQQFSQRALLLTQCQHPTPELLTFCQQLTDTVAIAFLTEDPLDLPLKGFPPHQPRLISAIETWLEEM